MSKQLEDFTVSDFDILIEAMDSWVNKDLAGQMAGDLMGALFSGRGEEAKQVAERERETRAAKQELVTKKRAEIATLLKTKLILQKHDLIDKGKEVNDNARARN